MLPQGLAPYKPAAMLLGLSFCALVGCSGPPAPTASIESEATQELEEKFAGNVFAVLRLDEKNPGCTSDPTQFDPSQLDASTFAACSGAVADQLPASLHVTTDSAAFDPTQATRSILAVLAPSPDPSDPHMSWYAVVGLGPATQVGGLAGTSAALRSSGLRPMVGVALLAGGGELLEAAGLAIPGVDVIAGALLAGTALYLATRDSGTTAPQALLDSIGSGASLVAGGDSGQCDTDQECCLEDGTASPSDPEGPPDDAAPQSSLDVDVFNAPKPEIDQNGSLLAYQDGVEALNTQTGLSERLTYMVQARLRGVGETLMVDDVNVVAIAADGKTSLTYLYRPGAGAMKSLMASVAKYLARELPWARTLIIDRTRATTRYGKMPDGTDRPNCLTKQYDLTRFR